MLSTTLIALGLFGAVWVSRYVLQSIIALSIDVEEQHLAAAAYPKNHDHLKSIAVLRSLEITLGTVFAAIMPLIGVLLGTVLPDPVRSFLAEIAGEKTIIIVSIMALFAYYSVLRTLWRQQGAKIRSAVVGLVRSS